MLRFKYKYKEGGSICIMSFGWDQLVVLTEQHIRLLKGYLG